MHLSDPTRRLSIGREVIRNSVSRLVTKIVKRGEPRGSPLFDRRRFRRLCRLRFVAIKVTDDGLGVDQVLQFLAHGIVLLLMIPFMCILGFPGKGGISPSSNRPVVLCR